MNPYSEGAKAFDQKKKLEDNPYPTNTKNHQDWEAGWWERYLDLLTDPL